MVFGQNCLYSGSVDLLGQSGCIRVKVFALGQKLLYSGKSDCIRKEWLYSAKWL